MGSKRNSSNSKGQLETDVINRIAIVSFRRCESQHSHTCNGLWMAYTASGLGSKRVKTQGKFSRGKRYCGESWKVRRLHELCVICVNETLGVSHEYGAWL